MKKQELIILSMSEDEKKQVQLIIDELDKIEKKICFKIEKDSQLLEKNGDYTYYKTDKSFQKALDLAEACGAIKQILKDLLDIERKK